MLEENANSDFPGSLTRAWISEFVWHGLCSVWGSHNKSFRNGPEVMPYLKRFLAAAAAGLRSIVALIPGLGLLAGWLAAWLAGWLQAGWLAGLLVG